MLQMLARHDCYTLFHNKFEELADLAGHNPVRAVTLLADLNRALTSQLKLHPKSGRRIVQDGLGTMSASSSSSSSSSSSCGRRDPFLSTGIAEWSSASAPSTVTALACPSQSAERVAAHFPTSLVCASPAYAIFQNNTKYQVAIELPPDVPVNAIGVELEGEEGRILRVCSTSPVTHAPGGNANQKAPFDNALLWETTLRRPD